MIKDVPFVVVDLETTGLHASLDEIIEIGAVKLLNGEVVDEWTSMLNPGIYVPSECTQISGITTEMLQHAPRFEEIVEEYLQFLGEGSVFVAHNVDFDRTFLNKKLEVLRRPLMGNPYLCTFKLAKTVHPNLSKYGLGSLSATFGVDLPQAHRALHDARATAQLLAKFLKILQNGGLKQLQDIPHIQNLPKESAQTVLEGQGSLF